MAKLEVFGRVINGKLSLMARDRLVDAIRKHDGKDIRIVIERKRKQRTTPQLRYYYGYCLPLLMAYFNDCGYEYSKEELDAFLRIHVLKISKNILGVWVPDHSSKLSAAEMEERFIWLRKWAVEAGCDIGEPGEHLYEKIGEAV